MKEPGNFSKGCGVLNVGMTVVIILYTCIGFLAYLKFGEEIQGSVTLNLPIEDVYVILLLKLLFFYFMKTVLLFYLLLLTLILCLFF